METTMKQRAKEFVIRNFSASIYDVISSIDLENMLVYFAEQEIMNTKNNNE